MTHFNKRVYSYGLNAHFKTHLKLNSRNDQNSFILKKRLTSDRSENRDILPTNKNISAILCQTCLGHYRKIYATTVKLFAFFKNISKLLSDNANYVCINYEQETPT